MPLQITNTLSGKKEAFVPLEKGRVRMYVCGPTVYGLTHVGNARPAVFFDVARRYFEHSGFKVTFVSNYTDVDDKIIDRARQEGIPAMEVAEKYIREFRKDMSDLGVRPPDEAPRVTENIPQIIAIIDGLVNNSHAYVTEGEVFYSVRRFRTYGKLSGKNIDELLAGTRVDPSEKKRDPLDFSLWKPRKAADEPAWPSPWGDGRPGWHIECSAMAARYLGETLDIHGGGIDLAHPHHENEIAQSEGFSGKPFARYWLHNNLVAINNEKMSKSLGNIFLNRDFIARYTAETLKFLLLAGHYRSPIDFSERQIRVSQAALHRVYSALARASELALGARGPDGPARTEDQALAEMLLAFSARWHEAMDDDLNTAKVVGQVFELVRAANACFSRKGFRAEQHHVSYAGDFLARMKDVSAILNLFAEQPRPYLVLLRGHVLRDRGVDPARVETLVRERSEARSRKDFQAADRLRDELAALGIEVRDGPNGSDWDIAFTADGMV